MDIARFGVGGQSPLDDSSKRVQHVYMGHMKRQWNRRNPIRRFKERHRLTYPELAEVLGISQDYARKLGSDGMYSLSIPMILQIEIRSDGEIKFNAVIRWIRDCLEKKAA